jgi:Phosphotransferase enzyme family
MSKTIKVSDPFGAAVDPALPSLKLALNPAEAREEFKHALPRLSGEQGRLHLRAIRVIRHKPGRRCLVEYDVKVVGPDGGVRERVTLVGKVRSRRFGNEGYRLLEAIWNAGFQTNSPDGISVPEPIGVIQKFQMWFQRKVPGRDASELLASAEGTSLAGRIAEAIHKLHQADVPTDRTHTMADELRILHERLPLVSQLKPELAARIERVLAACDRLGAGVPESRACGVHRDFYPAQVIVNANRLYLLDFDLFCLGNPSLDVGNFIGHLTETSLRTFGGAAALADREKAMEERFCQLTGADVRVAIRAYGTLTLVRHIYLSTQFPERIPFTESLLALCEERLATELK